MTKRAVYITEVKPFPDLLTTDEAAKLLNRKPQTLRRWAAYEDGPVRPVRINGRLAWPRSELEKLVPIPVDVSVKETYAYLNANATDWTAGRSGGKDRNLADSSMPQAEMVVPANICTVEGLRTSLAGAYALASRVEVCLLQGDVDGAKRKLDSLLKLLAKKCEDNAIFRMSSR